VDKIQNAKQPFFLKWRSNIMFKFHKNAKIRV